MSNTTTPATTNQPEDKDKALALFEPIRERCLKLMEDDKAFYREATFILQALHAEPSLNTCTRHSIVGCLLSVANTGISLNPIRKEAYLIPRNTKVKNEDGTERWEKRLTVVPSYVGLMRLATDSGGVKHFEAQVVYEGDEFEFDLVAGKPSKHVPYWTAGNERGKIRGAYGYAVLMDGSRITDHMGADELAKIRSMSDNKNGKVYTDWEGEMARKAVLKRLQKYAPRTDRSDRFLQAVSLDNEQFTLPPATVEERANSVLRRRVMEALDKYKGDDREELREEARAKIQAGEFTPVYATNLLASLGAAE